MSKLSKFTYCYFVNYISYTGQNLFRILLITLLKPLKSLVFFYKKKKLSDTEYKEYQNDVKLGMKHNKIVQKGKITTLLVIFNFMFCFSLLRFLGINLNIYTSKLREINKYFDIILFLVFIVFFYFINDRCLSSKKNSLKFEKEFLNKKNTSKDGLLFLLFIILYLCVFHYSLDINPIRSVNVILNLFQNGT